MTFNSVIDYLKKETFFESSTNWDTLTFILYLSIIGLFIISLMFYYKNKEIDLVTKDTKIIDNNLYLLIAFLVLFLPSSLRSIYSANDLIVYKTCYFDNVALLNPYEYPMFEDFIFISVDEPFFIWVNFLIRKLNLSFRIFLLVISFIVTISYISVITALWNKNKNFSPLLLFSMAYYNNLSGLRSALAISFVYFSISILIKYRTSVYRNLSIALLLLFSVLTHYTMVFSVIFFFYYLFMKYILNKKNRLINLIVSTIIFFVMCLIFVYTFSHFLLGTRYKGYITYNYLYFFGHWYRYLLFFILCVFYQRIDKNRNNMLSIYGFTYTIVILPLVILLGAYRITSYFTIFSIYVLSLVMFESTIKINKLIIKNLINIFYFIIVILFAIYSFSRLVASGENYFKYYTFIQMPFNYAL